VSCEPEGHPEAQRAPLAVQRVDVCAVLVVEHALRRRLAVGGERPPRGGLVEWNAEQPRALLPVGLALVEALQLDAAGKEVGIHVPETEDAPVGGPVVDGGERRGRSEQVVLDEPRQPADVAPRRRVAELGLGAPTVGRGHAQGQATVESRGIDAHATEDAQVAQGALALGHARRVVAISRIYQERAADDPRAGAGV